jgi:hypothetical protein
MNDGSITLSIGQVRLIIEYGIFPDSSAGV